MTTAKSRTAIVLVAGAMTGDLFVEQSALLGDRLPGTSTNDKNVAGFKAGDVACAVGAHDGQGAAARNAFNGLTAAQRADVVNFVLSM